MFELWVEQLTSLFIKKCLHFDVGADEMNLVFGFFFALFSKKCLHFDVWADQPT